MTWHYITWHDITLHYMTLHYITWHDITLHYMTWHYITWHDITWHYMTWYYITLHYITYIHTNMILAFYMHELEGSTCSDVEQGISSHPSDIKTPFHGPSDTWFHPVHHGFRWVINIRDCIMFEYLIIRDCINKYYQGLFVLSGIINIRDCIRWLIKSFHLLIRIFSHNMICASGGRELICPMIREIIHIESMLKSMSMFNSPFFPATIYTFWFVLPCSILKWIHMYIYICVYVYIYIYTFIYIYIPRSEKLFRETPTINLCHETDPWLSSWPMSHPINLNRDVPWYSSLPGWGLPDIIWCLNH